MKAKCKNEMSSKEAVERPSVKDLSSSPESSNTVTQTFKQDALPSQNVTTEQIVGTSVTYNGNPVKNVNVASGNMSATCNNGTVPNNVSAFSGNMNGNMYGNGNGNMYGNCPMGMYNPFWFGMNPFMQQFPQSNQLSQSNQTTTLQPVKQTFINFSGFGNN